MDKNLVEKLITERNNFLLMNPECQRKEISKETPKETNDDFSKNEEIIQSDDIWI